MPQECLSTDTEPAILILSSLLLLFLAADLAPTASICEVRIEAP
jgi:hypothetical protein